MEEIRFEVKDHIAVLTLCHPEKRNAVSKIMTQQMSEYARKINSDKDIHAVVLTGGPEMFCAGTDISDVLTSYPTPWDWRVRQVEYCRCVRSIIKPVIAQINGYCLGGGLEMACSADIRYASKSAKFGQPEITLGVLGGGGASQLLPRIVGLGMANEIAMTGRIYSAQEAAAMRLVDRLYDTPEDVETAVWKLAADIAKKSSTGEQLVKKAARVAQNTGVELGLEYENELLCIAYGTDDAKEGGNAFLNHRKPEFNKH